MSNYWQVLQQFDVLLDDYNVKLRLVQTGCVKYLKDTRKKCLDTNTKYKACVHLLKEVSQAQVCLKNLCKWTHVKFVKCLMCLISQSSGFLKEVCVIKSTRGRIVESCICFTLFSLFSLPMVSYMMNLYNIHYRKYICIYLQNESPVITIASLGKFNCEACKKKCKKEAIRLQDKYFHVTCFTCKGNFLRVTHLILS